MIDFAKNKPTKNPPTAPRTDSNADFAANPAPTAEKINGTKNTKIEESTMRFGVKPQSSACRAAR